MMVGVHLLQHDATIVPLNVAGRQEVTLFLWEFWCDGKRRDRRRFNRWMGHSVWMWYIYRKLSRARRGHWYRHGSVKRAEWNKSEWTLFRFHVVECWYLPRIFFLWLNNRCRSRPACATCGLGFQWLIDFEMNYLTGEISVR